MTRRPGRHRASTVAVLAVVATCLTPVTTVRAVTCTLAPVLRDKTINQGVGSYARLVRGKETLLRFYLSLPSCAPAGSSIAVKSARLTLSGAPGLTAVVSAYSPTSSSVSPLVAPYANAPALNAPADPVFAVPGALLLPTSATAFVGTFTASVTYLAKASSTAVGSTATASFAVTKQFEQRTGALRVLVVPMGDASQSYASQFDATDQAVTQKGLIALARMLPVPDAVTDLSPSATGGVRYRITPTLLDLRSFLTSGKLCGTATNFDGLKAQLGQFLNSWNAANPTALADRVLGVVSSRMSSGSTSSCAEGMGAISGTQAWVRAIPDQPASPTAPAAPSMTGALMAMELGHTMGLVPPSRANPYNAFHSAHKTADGDAPNRVYNTALRTFLATNRTAMALGDTWNQNDTVFESADWATLLCALGGVATGDCASPGYVGTTVNVPAAGVFELSGTTDGTAAGTQVTESFYGPGMPMPDDPASLYHLVQRAADTTVLADNRVATSGFDSSHGLATPSPLNAETVAAGVLGVTAAVAANTDADRVEFWYGVPDAAGSVLLYSRNRYAAPVVSSAGSSGGGGAPVPELASVNVNGSIAPSGSQNNALNYVSATGRYVAFTSSTSMGTAAPNGPADIFVRDRQAGTTDWVNVPADGSGVPNQGSFNPVVSPNGRYVAFVSLATNLTPAGVVTSGSIPEVFVTDRTTHITTFVSVTSAGTEPPGGGGDLPGSVTDDGRYVAFLSNSPLAGDGNGADDFIWDRTVNAPTLLSITSTGAIAPPAGSLSPPTMTADGQFAVFGTDQPLAATDTNGNEDVYLWDRTTGRSTRISVPSSGQPDTATAGFDPAITPDGRYIAYYTTGDLVGLPPSSGVPNVYRYDRTTGSTVLASVATDGSAADQQAYGEAISADGNRVAFVSSATNLATNDPIRSGSRDVYVRDISAGVTTKVNVTAAGGQPAGTVLSVPSISQDGATIGFDSSQVLVAADVNSSTDIYVATLPPSAAGSNVTTAITASGPVDDTRVSLYYNCGTVLYPVAVGLTPSQTAAAVASFTANFDPSLACTGGHLSVSADDGFSRSVPAPSTDVAVTTPDKTPTAAVYAPADGSATLQWDEVSARLAGWDPEQGVLAGPDLTWTLTRDADSVVAASGDGVTTLDIPAPTAGGWTPGVYTLAVTAHDGSGHTSVASTTVTILGDADHDGLGAPVEAQLAAAGCGGDSDPANAFGDCDGDGIPNVDDQYAGDSPIVAAPRYSGTAGYSPQPYVTAAHPNLTATVTLTYDRAKSVLGSTVRISRIEGLAVSAMPATTWRVKNGVATAVFDGPTLANYLVTNHLVGRPVTIEIAGTGETRRRSVWIFWTFNVVADLVTQ